jgi:hypothetical protein
MTITINDLFSELNPMYYSSLTLEHAIEMVDRINSTIEVLEEEGHEFEHEDVIKEVIDNYIGEVGL